MDSAYQLLTLQYVKDIDCFTSYSNYTYTFIVAYLLNIYIDSSKRWTSIAGPPCLTNSSANLGLY